MDIRYKYKQILTEGYIFSNVNEVMSALKANKIGVKINNGIKLKIQESKTVGITNALNMFFNKCQQLGIKDTTYGVQILLSKCYSDWSIYHAVENDALYEFLKSYKKPWVKQLPEYQEFMNNEYEEKVWHKLEKAIQEEQTNHGKTAKGSGDSSAFKIAYEDDTWKLIIPSSFEGEKAAAFYIKDGKETPTEWCTRCDKSYYDRYSKNAPLYIIRNMKTGKSYQMAFTKETHWDDNKSDTKVHFLDQNDVKGDEITTGDLSKIPDELLKHIRIPFGAAEGKTMANFKNEEAAPSPHKGEKGYEQLGKKKYSEEKIIDKKYQREVAKWLDDYNEKRRYGDTDFYKKYADVDIVKIVSTKGTLSAHGRDEFSEYANNGKRVKDDYQPKARYVRYYFLNHPDYYVEFVASKKNNTGPAVADATADGKDRSLLQYTGFYELGYGIPTKEISKIARPNAPDEEQNTDWVSKGAIKAAKRRQNETIKEQNFMKIIRDYAKEIGAEELGINIASITNGGLSVRKRPKASLKDEMKTTGSMVVDWKGQAVGKKWSFGGMFKDGRQYTINGVTGGTRFFIEVENKRIPSGPSYSISDVKLFERNGEFGSRITDKYREFAYKISKKMFETWRKLFGNEIAQNRVEGGYTHNMYEELNYFPY